MEELENSKHTSFFCYCFKNIRRSSDTFRSKSPAAAQQVIQGNTCRYSCKMQFFCTAYYTARYVATVIHTTYLAACLWGYLSYRKVQLHWHPDATTRICSCSIVHKCICAKVRYCVLLPFLLHKHRVPRTCAIMHSTSKKLSTDRSTVRSGEGQGNCAYLAICGLLFCCVQWNGFHHPSK